jgi:signal transduction histidine kinase
MMVQEYRDPTKLASRTRNMEELINSSIRTVQLISSELRPVMLDLLGIADSIDWQVREFQRKTGIVCKTVILLGDKCVNRDVSTAIYRILQEALNNVIQHSGAKHVEVFLLGKKGRLTLVVRDNGRGITAREKNSNRSHGISGMRERSAALSGKLRICGSSQQGTALFARIPLAVKEN